jgi:hypothetical protein
MTCAPPHRAIRAHSWWAIATRSKEVRGPDASGEFIAILPNGEHRHIRTGAELDALVQEWGVLVKKGDLAELERRPDPSRRRGADDPPEGLSQARGSS